MYQREPEYISRENHHNTRPRYNKTNRKKKDHKDLNKGKVKRNRNKMHKILFSNGSTVSNHFSIVSTSYSKDVALGDIEAYGAMWAFILFIHPICFLVP